MLYEFHCLILKRKNNQLGSLPNNQKKNVASFQQIYGKMSVSFWYTYAETHALQQRFLISQFDILKTEVQFLSS